MLWSFANGLDNSSVRNIDNRSLVKSVGNSTTAPRDLVCDNDIRITIFALSESIAARLREYGFLCRTVQISVRDKNLNCFQRQVKLDFPTCVSTVIADVAFKLFKRNTSNPYEIRSIGVRACDLLENDNNQLSFWPQDIKNQRLENLETAVDSIRNRFGYFSVQRGIMLSDRQLSNLNAKEDHVIFPVSFLG